MGSERARYAFWTLACMLAVPPHAAAQQNYPVKPIRLVVPLAPGGPSDILARSMSQAISPGLGQSVVVDNRTGASGHAQSDRGPPLSRVCESVAIPGRAREIEERGSGGLRHTA